MPSDSSASTALPNMSPATKDVIARVRQMIPPMLEKFHKGK
jgi:ATP-dependent NAD(P)H-hydrate dehydratase